MLAPSNEFGYASVGHHAHAYDQPQHSAERPKLYGLETQPMHSVILHGGIHDYHHHPHHSTPQHHAMTPQHHQASSFDHEPLMMNMHNPHQYYTPQLGTAVLHVSADYGSGSSVGGVTPSSTTGAKRSSREELNLKEKKRMYKLNDRINQLKEMLDEAGVQTKKNKQSILDNTSHYISMLRSNLLIAKQKAERMEKQVEVFRTQAQKNGGSMDLIYKRSFQNSTTPRIVVDLAMQVVTFNSAFLIHTGLTPDDLKDTEQMRASLCMDKNKLDRLIQDVTNTANPKAVVVEARTAAGIASVTLMASIITDEMGKPTSVDFSVIPVETQSEPERSQQEAIKAEPTSPGLKL